MTEFNSRQIEELLESDGFRAIDAAVSQPNFWGIAGVARREHSHSNFVAWVLDRKPPVTGVLPLS